MSTRGINHRNLNTLLFEKSVGDRPVDDEMLEVALFDQKVTGPWGKFFAPFLIFVLFSAVYFNFSLLFPFDLYIVPGLIAFGIYVRQKWMLLFVFTFAVFAASHYIVTTSGSASQIVVEEQIRSTGLFIFSVAASIGFIQVCIVFGRRRLLNFVVCFIIFITVGLLLERLGILRDLSDFVRQKLYIDTIVYTNDARDIASYGFVRPKLFASEPSYVAKTFGLLIACAVVLGSKTASGVWLFMLVLAFPFLLPSPAFAPGAIFAISFWAFSSDSFFKDRRGARFAIIAIFLTILCITLVAILARVGFLGDDVDPSAYQRLMQPVYLAFAALEQRPLLGFGVGADYSMQQILSNVLSQSGAPQYILERERENVFSGTLHFSVLWQLGLLGAIFFYYSMLFLVRRLCEEKLLLVVVYSFLLGFVSGDIHTPAYWGFLMPLLACCFLANSDRVKNA